MSVLLASFNHVNYVADAINSVLSQTYNNIELIVIDDGSTDGTAEKVADLARIHGFIFIPQENIGYQRTLARLTALATGKYISPFASDDIYEPTKIEKLVRFLEYNPEYVAVHSKICIIDANGEIQRVIDEPCRSGMVFEELLRGDFRINGISALVRADVYREVERHNDYVDDLPVWLELARDHQIAFFNEVTARYRLHNNHLTSNISKMMESELEIISRYKDAGCYKDAILALYLRWFWVLAGSNKIAAVKKLFVTGGVPKFIFKSIFYKGLLRLFFRW